MAEKVTTIEIGDDNDLAWGVGYDCAKSGGSRDDCPYDMIEQPLAAAEWLAGWEDGSR